MNSIDKEIMEGRASKAIDVEVDLIKDVIESRMNILMKDKNVAQTYQTRQDLKDKVLYEVCKRFGKVCR